MAKNSITDYDNTSGNNTDVQSVDISEGCSPSGINNAIREVMADLADVNDGTVALTSPQAANMTVTGTVTTDTIAENTSAAGVTIDGVLLKDGGVGSATAAIAAYLSSLNGGQLGGNRNLIINGAMQVAQRSTSATGLTSTGYHSIDRFRTSLFNGGTWTQSQSTTVPSGEGFGYSLKMDCTTADTSLLTNHHCILQHHIEGQNLQQLKYGTSSAESITLSFWVRSSKTGTYTVEFEQLGNTKQYSQTYSISTADTWQKVTLTIDGDTASSLANDNSCELRVNWYLAAGADYTSGTFNNSAWATTTTGNRVSSSQVNLADSTSNDWYITGVQLEVGEQATPFEHRSYGDELARCQRYYSQINASSSASSGIGVGHGNSNTLTILDVFPPVFPMRTAATASLSAASTFTANTPSISAACSAKSVSSVSDRQMRINFTHTSDSNTTYGSRLMRFNNTSGFIGFDAEL